MPLVLREATMLGVSSTGPPQFRGKISETLLRDNKVLASDGHRKVTSIYFPAFLRTRYIFDLSLYLSQVQTCGAMASGFLSSCILGSHNPR
jgi:hypothetical protein